MWFHVSHTVYGWLPVGSKKTPAFGSDIRRKLRKEPLPSTVASVEIRELHSSISSRFWGLLGLRLRGDLYYLQNTLLHREESTRSITGGPSLEPLEEAKPKCCTRNFSHFSCRSVQRLPILCIPLQHLRLKTLRTSITTTSSFFQLRFLPMWTPATGA